MAPEWGLFYCTGRDRAGNNALGLRRGLARVYGIATTFTGGLNLAAALGRKGGNELVHFGFDGRVNLRGMNFAGGDALHIRGIHAQL